MKFDKQRIIKLQESSCFLLFLPEESALNLDGASNIFDRILEAPFLLAKFANKVSKKRPKYEVYK